jgi:predicted alpha/beta hydrolase
MPTRTAPPPSHSVVARAVVARPVQLVSTDGFPLAATHWSNGDAARGVVLIAPATGAPHRFYRHFAGALVGAGFEVLSWDWRGMAASASAEGMRDPRLTMRAWGERDLTAAIAWADHQAAGRRVMIIGHSFGGQAIGLAQNAARLERAVLIGAQHGYVGLWPWRLQPALRLLWRVVMPAAAALLGRFPSSALGLGLDLPAGVAREWATWCARREHLGTWDGHARLTIPMLALSFDDDPFAPRRPAVELLAKYANARIHHQHLRREGLGHFGFFRPGLAERRWRMVIEFLRRDTAGA